MGNKPSEFEQAQPQVQHQQYQPQQQQQQQGQATQNAASSSNRERTHSEEQSSGRQPLDFTQQTTTAAVATTTQTQPMRIGGAVAKPEMETWDDDNSDGDHDGVGVPMMNQLNLISQSAPVYSHRFPRDMPQRPILKPIEPQQLSLNDVDEIVLPPPSLPDRVPFSLGHHDTTNGAVSQSVPLSRSLLQSAMSLPPHFAAKDTLKPVTTSTITAAASSSTIHDTASTSHSSNNNTVTTRTRHGSIIDLISAENLAKEVTSTITHTLDKPADDTHHDSDDELPFR